jgi:putative nucleotidyltransferase with HDIG domain
MRTRLLELVPEFALIEAAALREQTIAVWLAALAEGDWTPDSLATLPFTLLINPCPASYLEHVRAVTLTAVRAAEVFRQIYGERAPIDMDVLVAGGLLHDIGKLSEYERTAGDAARQSAAGALLRHPFLGTALAARFGIPLAVQHIIATHAGEGDRVTRSTEATLINHADFMSFHALQRLQPQSEVGARMG